MMGKVGYDKTSSKNKGLCPGHRDNEHLTSTTTVIYSVIFCVLMSDMNVYLKYEAKIYEG